MCSLHFNRSTGQELHANVSQPSVSRFKAAWVPPCQPESLARCGGQDQEEARAGAVMAGAGGAAGPAQDVRHQPPGDSDAKEERGQTNVYNLRQKKKQYLRADACSAVVMPAESMHKITGSNPVVMHNFSNCFENLYIHV